MHGAGRGKQLLNTSFIVHKDLKTNTFETHQPQSPQLKEETNIWQFFLLESRINSEIITSVIVQVWRPVSQLGTYPSAAAQSTGDIFKEDRSGAQM